MTALSIKLGVISDLITSVILATIVSSYDKVSANTASSVPKYYKKIGPIIGLYVLFVSKRSDQKYKSANFS